MAAITSALIGAAGAIGGGILASKASKSAAKTQAAAADRAAQLQHEQYLQTRGDLEPYRNLGTGSIGLYNDSLGLNGAAGNTRAVNAFQAGPGYSFAMNEGIKARDMSAAARGGLYSGAYAKELTRYGQGVANQEYGGWQNRLFGNVQLGQNAAAMTGNLGAQAANAQGNYLTQGANATAAGQIGSANAWLGALQGVAGVAGDYFGRSGTMNSPNNNWFAGTGSSTTRKWGW